MQSNRPILLCSTLLRLLAAAIIAVPVVLLSGCGRPVFRVNLQQQPQSVSGATGLNVECRNGAITVVHDPAATDLIVDAEIRCAGMSIQEATERAQQAAVRVEMQPDGTAVVRVEFPPAAAGQAKYVNDGATIKVRAAALNRLYLKTGNGSITTDGFHGPLEAHTNNGRITIGAHSGAVTARTSNGGIQVNSALGPVDAETSNGKVSVALAEGATGNATLRTSNGGVELILPASWNGRVSASTSNGRVKVNAPEGRASQVHTETGVGDAVIGQGGTAVAEIRTSNGGVTITVQDAGTDR